MAPTRAHQASASSSASLTDGRESPSVDVSSLPERAVMLTSIEGRGRHETRLFVILLCSVSSSSFLSPSHGPAISFFANKKKERKKEMQKKKRTASLCFLLLSLPLLLLLLLLNPCMKR